VNELDFLNEPAEIVAPRLLGCLLIRELSGQKLTGRIVETEAYAQHDAASHSYRGKTLRNDVMFGPSGYLYVYFTYGMHYCMNVVTGGQGEGSAVLIRAIEPVEGEAAMQENRGGKIGIEITNGPAKLCQAMSIGRDMNGHDLRKEPLRLTMQPPLEQAAIVQTTRVGITQATEVPWRYYERGNPYVSRP
jgi:DNA-3-methyladenine glycosylase